jgi:hypothetical protein
MNFNITDVNTYWNIEDPGEEVHIEENRNGHRMLDCHRCELWTCEDKSTAKQEKLD